MPKTLQTQYPATAGFTIVEVLVASLIFTIAVAGVLATMSSLNAPTAESTDEVTAAFVGKRVLDQLRKEVEASNTTGWSAAASPLNPTGGDGAGAYDASIPATATLLAPVTIDGITYTPTYVVEPDPDGTSGRKVTLTVTW